MPASPDDRLDSWKEIAAYLKRGVRTVRRWEREEGLPVHRHVHRVLGSVYAYKSEIESWRQTGQRRRHAVAFRGRPQRYPTVGQIKSIAVLPFTNLSTDPENEYFADGLTDEVTADLSKIGALRVISRTSAMTFKRTTKDVSTIARELGVRYLLEGSVRRAGDRLRITAQLIDAATDDHLWADKYDGSVEDVFAIQERLARVIVEALELRLTADEDRRLADRPIANVHAYECYLRARQEAWRWRKDAIDHAIQLLHNGLAVVGDNARLYAALGHAYLQYREAGIDFGEGPLDEAEACARKVIRARAGIRVRVAAAWLDPLRPRADPRRGSRSESGARDRAQQRRHASSADQLLPDLRKGLGRASAHRARAGGRSPHPGQPLHASFCRCPWKGTLPRPSSRTGRCVKWIQATRWRGCSTSGCWPSIAGRMTSARSSTRFHPRCARPSRRGWRFSWRTHLRGTPRDAHAAVTEEIEAVATAADVFPRILAQGYALAGMSERALHWLAIAVDRGFINYPFLRANTIPSSRGSRPTTIPEAARDRP